MYVCVYKARYKFVYTLYKNGYIKVNRNEYFKEKKVDFP